MTEEIKTKVALLKQEQDNHADDIRDLKAGHKEILSGIRRALIAALISLTSILGYIGKGILDKIGFGG